MMRHDIYSLWQNWLQFCWNMQTHLVAPVTRIRWPDWKNVVAIPIFISHLKTLKLHFRYLIYGRKPLVWKLSSKKHQFRFHIQKKNNNDEVISELCAKERWASEHISTHTAFNIPLFHSNLLLYFWRIDDRTPTVQCSFVQIAHSFNVCVSFSLTKNIFANDDLIEHWECAVFFHFFFSPNTYQICVLSIEHTGCVRHAYGKAYIQR